MNEKYSQGRVLYNNGQERLSDLVISTVVTLLRKDNQSYQPSHYTNEARFRYLKEYLYNLYTYASYGAAEVSLHFKLAHIFFTLIEKSIIKKQQLVQLGLLQILLKVEQDWHDCTRTSTSYYANDYNRFQSLLNTILKMLSSVETPPSTQIDPTNSANESCSSSSGDQTLTEMVSNFFRI